jgi:hypothetical protein
MTKVSTEELKAAYNAQLQQDRNALVMYLMASMIAIEAIDELSSDKTPFKWVHQETKYAFKNFDEIFRKKNKTHIENLFALQDEGLEQGEMLISTQEGAKERLEAFAQIVSRIPVVYWDEFMEKVMAITFEPKPQVNELKLNVDEGEE